MREFSRVCACVLAADASQRMGARELLAPFAGSALLDCALDAALGCAVQEVVAVTGAYRDETAPVVARAGVKEVRNSVRSRGRASSVKAAVRHAERAGFDAVLLMSADQPFVTSSHLNTLLYEYDNGRDWAYLCATENRNGSPCLFDKRCYPVLLGLKGDEGVRALFRRHPDLPARYVYFDDADLFEEVDKPEDLARLDGFAVRARGTGCA